MLSSICAPIPADIVKVVVEKIERTNLHLAEGHSESRLTMKIQFGVENAWQRHAVSPMNSDESDET
jgi:hypothetical protein